MILALSIAILLFVGAVMVEAHMTWLFLTAILMFSIASFKWEMTKERLNTLEEKIKRLESPFEEDK
jgi:hypothetical protein